MMVDDSETSQNTVRVGHGAPLEGDGIWIRDESGAGQEPRSYSESVAAVEWMKRRNDLAEHCEFMARLVKRRHTEQVFLN